MPGHHERAQQRRQAVLDLLHQRPGLSVLQINAVLHENINNLRHCIYKMTVNGELALADRKYTALVHTTQTVEQCKQVRNDAIAAHHANARIARATRQVENAPGNPRRIVHTCSETRPCKPGGGGGQGRQYFARGYSSILGKI